ncbi:unnamed protein product [Diabrotica balteata]|uniref:Uncharacterized protein n=1 Tax=Diabrotica balteata TaxID=107213 RepID=A0A9N9T550_DIABA|nr:unnamed protein product [Diabrotica balteata]
MNRIIKGLPTSVTNTATTRKPRSGRAAAPDPGIAPEPPDKGKYNESLSQRLFISFATADPLNKKLNSRDSMSQVSPCDGR